MSRLNVLIFTFILLSIQGCASQQKVNDREVGGLSRVGLVKNKQMSDSAMALGGLDKAGVVYIGLTDKTAKTHIRSAEEAIKNSADYDKAKIELGRSLYASANNGTARFILAQLVTDPVDYAISQGFKLHDSSSEYLVKKNDNLERISIRIYGNALYYPFIMRLNKLNSSVLSEGQALWLPSPKNKHIRAIKKTPSKEKKLDKVITRTPEPRDDLNSVVSSDAPPEESSSENNVHSPSTSISLETDSGETKGEASQIATSINTTENQDTSNSLDISEEEMLDASEESSITPESIVNSEEAASLPSSDELLGISAYESGNYKQAYLLLKGVSNLSLKGDQAYRFVTTTLISDPYSQGLVYYQAQKLTLAIDEFNKVLSVEPNHSQANIYKARCQTLLDKLKKIE